MLKEYQISNFKAFAGPEIIPIKPITLIFGPNSSGKSSILQSILMLKQTLDEAKSQDTVLLFKGDLVDVGSYREVIHDHDTSKCFSFKVTIQKPMNLTDELPFSEFLDQEDALPDGFFCMHSSYPFETMGMSITFSYNEELRCTRVTEIQLFFGDDPESIIRYEPGAPHQMHEPWVHQRYKKRPESFFVVKRINDKHKYWRTSPKVSVEETTAKFQSMSEEEQERAKNAARFGIETPGITKKEIIELEIPDIDGRCRPKIDWIQLQNYLPGSLNGSDSVEMTEGFASNGQVNISFFALTVSSVLGHFLKELEYVGPLRSFPERYFTFSGIETQYVGKTGKYVPDILIGNEQLRTKVNEQLDRFGVGYELKIDTLSSQISDIRDLFALRLYKESTGMHVGITDVGFGVSQVLPIIVQSLLSIEKTILIEQPELHLHPRLQAELGDLFIASAMGESKNTLIIETHSEHLLLRIMRRIRETATGKLPTGLIPLRPENVMVLFVNPEGSRSVIHEMPLNEKGELVNPWPGGFFEEDFEELF